MIQLININQYLFNISHSGTPSGLLRTDFGPTRNLSDTLSRVLRCFRTYQNISLTSNAPLSVLPYGSGILQTLSETPLWQMITSGTWMAIVTHVHSRRSFVVEPQTSILIPFAYTILVMSEIWSSVSEYLVRSRFRHYYFTHSRDLTSQWPSHKLRNLDVISPSGPRVSIRHAE